MRTDLHRRWRTTAVAACLMWTLAPAAGTAQRAPETDTVPRVRLEFGASAPRLTTRAALRGWVDDELKERLGLGAADRVAPDESSSSLGSYRVVRLAQTARGLPVVYRESRLLLDRDARPVRLLGAHSAFREAPEPIPGLSSAEAYSAAGGADVDVWASRLVFWPDGSDLRLSYELEGVFPNATAPAAPFERVFVDASTGRVLDRLSLTQRAMDRRVHDFGLACRNLGVGRAMNQHEFDLVFSQSPLVRSEWFSTGDRLAERYFRRLGQVHSLLRMTLGIDSIDNRGTPLVVFIGVLFHPKWGAQCIGTDDNAMWNGRFVLLPYTALEYGDVIGHEFAHGLIRYGSQLIYRGRSGALNEAISDAVGVTFKVWTANGAPPSMDAPIAMSPDDWILRDSAGPLRNMRNPRRIRGMPDHDDDYVRRGDVHINSSIVNQSFYLLTEGGQHPRRRRGPVVDGIGIMKAMRIFADAGRLLLTPKANFERARYAFASAAEAHHGRNSREWVAVHTAMDAVGIGGAWQRPPTRPPTRPTTPPPPPRTNPVTVADPPDDPAAPEADAEEEEDAEEEDEGDAEEEDEGDAEEDAAGGPPVEPGGGPPGGAQDTNRNLLILLLMAGLALLLTAAAVYRFRQGRAAARLHAQDEPPGRLPPVPPAPPPDAHSAPGPTPPGELLGVLQPADGSQPIPLPQGRLSSPEGLLLGRDARLCDVALQNPAVSRRHLRLRASGGGLLVEDLNSLDGTYLDGTLLRPFEPYPIAPGQTLGIAGKLLHLRLGNG